MERERYITEIVRKLVFKHHKMCFISGPRHVGKTTLAKHFLKGRGKGNYWNWDEIGFRRLWAKNPSLIAETTAGNICPIIVLDEIHKAKNWKRSLKGVFDTLEKPVDIIVTCSARLDVYQKGSDSLLGRYLPIRLHPLTVGELSNSRPQPPEELLNSLRNDELPAHESSDRVIKELLQYGGFPEPYYSRDLDFVNVWRRTRTEKLVREDLRDLSRLPELSQLEMLVALLPERAAKPLSRQSLSEDLEVAYTTISRWLQYLSVLYYNFETRPFSSKIKNTLKREGKLYLWDYSEISDDGARFENLVASHLLKACHFWTDSGKGNFELKYLRNKAGNEIDFLVVKDRRPWLPVEVKSGDTSPSPHWRVFMPQISCDLGVQVVRSPRVDKVFAEGPRKIRILSANSFLGRLP